MTPLSLTVPDIVAPFQTLRRRRWKTKATETL